jgi:hypothetical protein
MCAPRHPLRDLSSRSVLSSWLAGAESRLQRVLTASASLTSTAHMPRPRIEEVDDPVHHEHTDVRVSVREVHTKTRRRACARRVCGMCLLECSARVLFEATRPPCRAGASVPCGSARPQKKTLGHAGRGRRRRGHEQARGRVCAGSLRPTRMRTRGSSRTCCADNAREPEWHRRFVRKHDGVRQARARGRPQMGGLRRRECADPAPAPPRRRHARSAHARTRMLGCLP